MEAARSDFGVEREWTDTGFTGAGSDICVVDTGVEKTHEQFVDEATNANKVVAFKDFVGDVYGEFPTESYDDHEHGTHVAATAAGDGTGSALAARLRGAAPGARIHAGKVLDANGSGTISGIIAGIQWCTLSGPDHVGDSVDVINMSLGVSGSSDCNDSRVTFPEIPG